MATRLFPLGRLEGEPGSCLLLLPEPPACTLQFHSTGFLDPFQHEQPPYPPQALHQVGDTPIEFWHDWTLAAETDLNFLTLSSWSLKILMTWHPWIHWDGAGLMAGSHCWVVPQALVSLGLQPGNLEFLGHETSFYRRQTPTLSSSWAFSGGDRCPGLVINGNLPAADRHTQILGCRYPVMAHGLPLREGLVANGHRCQPHCAG